MPKLVTFAQTPHPLIQNRRITNAIEPLMNALDTLRQIFHPTAAEQRVAQDTNDDEQSVMNSTPVEIQPIELRRNPRRATTLNSTTAEGQRVEAPDNVITVPAEDPNDPVQLFDEPITIKIMHDIIAQYFANTMTHESTDFIAQFIAGQAAIQHSTSEYFNEAQHTDPDTSHCWHIAAKAATDDQGRPLKYDRAVDVKDKLTSLAAVKGNDSAEWLAAHNVELERLFVTMKAMEIINEDELPKGTILTYYNP